MNVCVWASERLHASHTFTVVETRKDRSMLFPGRSSHIHDYLDKGPKLFANGAKEFERSSRGKGIREYIVPERFGREFPRVFLRIYMAIN